MGLEEAVQSRLLQAETRLAQMSGEVGKVKNRLAAAQRTLNIVADLKQANAVTLCEPTIEAKDEGIGGILGCLSMPRIQLPAELHREIMDRIIEYATNVAQQLLNAAAEVDLEK